MRHTASMPSADTTRQLTLEAPNAPRRGPTVVNDVHSRLNATRVRDVVGIRSIAEARAAIIAAAPNDGICIAGPGHAMGGQQFLENGILLDTRGFDRVIALDRARGLAEVESGIQWPELIRQLGALQGEGEGRWTIRQKQTGADNLSIGGALSANVHGRGLTMRPLIDDVEAFTLLDAWGELRRCSRTENRELFRLAIGGYGLFGFIASVTLRLTWRHRLRRVAELVTSDRLATAFEERTAAGAEYGDFQFAVDPDSPDFLHRGILSTYHPVASGIRRSVNALELTTDQWRQLLFLAHADKSRAFDLYAAHYLATSGQEYWSDLHQLSLYLDDYHRDIDDRLLCRGYGAPGTEVITELFVPKERLRALLAGVREDFRRNEVDLVYGTIRLIERDDESFLPWARQSSVCVIFNVHTPHTAEGRDQSAETCRRLIDLALENDGSYYLTYHRHARRDQVLACHPRLPDMLRKKIEYDPGERFQSEWYRWYRDLLTGG
jgi:FAD/FMN-containing dehydrogenase